MRGLPLPRALARGARVALVVAAAMAAAATPAASLIVRGAVDVSGGPPRSAEQSGLAAPLPLHELRVTLDGRRTALVLADGSFSFADVEPGTHELAVVDPVRYFARGAVDVPSSAAPSEPRSGATYYDLLPTQSGWVRRELKPGQPLVLRAVGWFDYFEKRQTVSVAAFLMNPMFLLMLFSLVVGWGMPKLMEGLDPEELRELQRQQAATRDVDPSRMLNNMLSGKSPADGHDSDAD